MQAQRWISILVVLTLTLCWAPQVSATESDQFTRDGSDTGQVTITFDEAGSDEDTTITFPAVEVLEASLEVSPEAHDGAYAEGVWLDVRGNSKYEWAFDGAGYGAFGQQYRFANGRTAWTMNLGVGDETDVVDLLLPADATVESATLSISGLPTVEEDMTNLDLASAYTNEGSISAIPDITVDHNDTLHMVWIDDGDLEENNTSDLDVFYRNWDGNDWSPIRKLSHNLMGMTAPVPTIATAGDHLYVAWPNYPFDIEWTVSEDLGATWSQPTNLTPSDSIMVYSPVLAASGSEVHLAWQDAGNHDGDGVSDYDILYSFSNDRGGNWTETQVVSDGASDSESMNPDLALAGSDLYVAWSDNGSYDGDGESDYDIIHRYTTNDGTSWSGIQTVSTTTANGSQPAVAADATGDIHVAWHEFDPFTGDYEVRYRHSGNRGINWDVERTMTQTGNDLMPQLADVAFDGSNVYVAWHQTDNDTLEPHIKLRGSTNGGNSFAGAQDLDDGDYSRFRVDVSLALDDDDNLWASWSDRQQEQLPGGEYVGNEQDIWARRSTAGGSNWGTFLVASEQYYEADSGNVHVTVDDEGNYYAIYWDAGDHSGNGNDLHGDDGDIFFIRSTDGGVNWSDPFVLTQHDNDGLEYDYYYIPPDIAAGPDGHVYTVWFDRGPAANGSQPNLTFRRSTDYGESWDPLEVVFNSPTNSYYPCVEANGDTVHIFWNQYDGNTYRNYYLRSGDRGVNWDDPVILADQVADHLSLDARDGLVVAGWENAGSFYYAISRDDGLQWSEATRLDVDGNVDQPMLAFDDTHLYLVYREDEDDDNYMDVIMCLSNDTGQTWEDPLVLSHSDGFDRWYPSVDARYGMIVISYFAYDPDMGHYDQFIIGSMDNGRNWNDEQTISTGAGQDNVPTVSATPASVAVSGQAMVVWRDSQSLKNRTHVELWSLASNWNKYPSNPSLRLGDPGPSDWQYRGGIGVVQLPHGLGRR